MLKNNKYYYEDCHMYFNFNNINSRDYNLFIVSDNGEQTINSSSESSVEFISPASQNGAYLLGATKSQKKIKLKLATDGLNLEQYKEMIHWLDIGQTGFYFRYNNIYWGYQVVVEDISDSTVIFKSDDTIIAEFEVTFATLNGALAEAHYNAVLTNVLTQETTNEYEVPELFYYNDKLYVINTTKFPVVLDLNFNNVSELNISSLYDQANYYNINNILNIKCDSTKNIKIKGKYGFILDEDNKPIEISDSLLSINQNYNIFSFEESPNIELKIELYKKDTNNLFYDKEEVEFDIMQNIYSYKIYITETDIYQIGEINAGELPITTYYFRYRPYSFSTENDIKIKPSSAILYKYNIL